MKKKILVRGPALSQSGYGEHARMVLRALKEREDLYRPYRLGPHRLAHNQRCIPCLGRSTNSYYPSRYSAESSV